MWVLMPAGAEAVLVLALWYTALPASWCQRAKVAGTMLVSCWVAAPACLSTCRLHSTGLQLPITQLLPMLPMQGVPSVARAAAVTGIHDPALLEVSKPYSVLASSYWQACHEVLLVLRSQPLPSPCAGTLPLLNRRCWQRLQCGPCRSCRRPTSAALWSRFRVRLLAGCRRLVHSGLGVKEDAS